MVLESLHPFQLSTGTSLADQSFTALFGSFDETNKAFSTASNSPGTKGMLVIFDADSTSSVNASAVWVALSNPLNVDFLTPNVIKFHTIL